MRLLIVIVNYRTADLTIDCLQSLQREVAMIGDAHVAVVDGHSQDDSVTQLARAIRDRGWQSWTTLIPLSENRGFASGNNAAINAAMAQVDEPDYIALLNPDTIVRDGAMATLMTFMDERPEVGIAGPRLEERDGTPQCSAFRFPSAIGDFENRFAVGKLRSVMYRWVVAPNVRDDRHETDWVSGACMIVRRQVIEDIGAMDDGYFLYFEETDFCLRAHRLGWTVWYVPDSRVIHLVSQATGVSLSAGIGGDDHTAAARPRRRPTYWFDSRRRYYTKNYGLMYTLLTDLAWIAGSCGGTIKRWLKRQPPYDPPRLFIDFIRNSALVKGKA